MTKKNVYLVSTRYEDGVSTVHTRKEGYEAAKDLKFFRDALADVSTSEFAGSSTTIEKLQ